MSAEKTKEEIIQHKKRAIRKVNSLFESYLSSDDSKLLKKVDLLSYWLEEYTSYIQQENMFDSNRLLRYSRGNVIRVNFGFNVGKELGGLHLAVVLDDDNKRNADVITVIPLSSTDGKTVHPRSVDLGMELYERIFSQFTNMLEDTKKNLSELEKSSIAITKAIELLDIQTDEQKASNDFQLKMQEIKASQKDMLDQKTKLNKDLSILERNTTEIERLKIGSMAVTNQITTVSKQRIYVPKKSTDFLYGISLSASTMEKISSKLKELYFHE